MQNLKCARYQTGNICDALADVVETTDNSERKSEAESLVSFFLNDLIFQVNLLRKEIQIQSSDLSSEIPTYEELWNWLKVYREKGFEDAFVVANDFVENLGTAPQFKA